MLPWIPVFLMLGIFVLMQWFGKLPPIETIQQLATITNTKGGNIFILATMSIIFFFTAIRMTYWCLDRVAAKAFTADNAVLMLGLSFVTGTAFGGAFSSMLKAMSGEPPIGGSSTTVSSTQPARTTVTTSTPAGTPAPGEPQ